jgi:5'-3' exonuclease
LLETIIIIDASYFCFHRFYSIARWWKNAHPEEETNTDNPPYLDPRFAEKFEKTFISVLRDIPKELGINKNIKPLFLIGKDCKRENIWRNKWHDNYKGNRKSVEGASLYFKRVFEEEWFQKAYPNCFILNHPQLEADDCIALTVKKLLQKNRDKENKYCIYIITSDKDYLQLVEPRVKIFDLSYKNIAEQKSSTGNAAKDLFCKIVMGDPSDNIGPVLQKCGPKTAVKCFEDRIYFEERMKKENAYEKFKTNQTLIDFEYIPENLQLEFNASLPDWIGVL